MASSVAQLLIVTALLTACAAPNKDREASTARLPAIQFRITPLDLAAGDTARNHSVWSQNDYRDSVQILISGADGTVLPHVVVHLVLKESVEGDGRGTGAAPVTVPWRTITALSVDSLPETLYGRLLLTIRPSVLWQGATGRSPVDMFPAMVRVEIRLENGSITRSLDLHWD